MATISFDREMLLEQYFATRSKKKLQKNKSVKIESRTP